MTDLKYTLHGNDLQLLTIYLSPRQSIVADPGAMIYMDNQIKMHTSTSAGGGLMKGVARWLGGSDLFLTEFSNESSLDGAEVGFAASYPGMIVPVDLDVLGGTYFCQKRAYLCSQPSVEISIAFTKKLRAGFFGGDGFILQKLTGRGIALLHAGGTLYKRTLDRGEKLRVDAGCVVGFSHTIEYSVGFVGGVRNILFGGEGLFLAELVGPGDVIIQSLPFNKLVGHIIDASGLASR
jgi:uncharacterized protein (TIGR00266 family)